MEDAPQRTASRKASSRAGASKPVGSGRAIFSWTLEPWLQLPEDLELLAETFVVDGDQRYEVLRLGRNPAGGDRERAALDVGDDISALPNLGKLPLFRRRG